METRTARSPKKRAGRASSPATRKAKPKAPIPPHATLEREYVLCGKPTCKRLHGPYWYAYWKERGRTRKRYVGSHDALAKLLASWGASARRDEWEEDEMADAREWRQPGARGRRRPWAKGGGRRI